MEFFGVLERSGDVLHEKYFYFIKKNILIINVTNGSQVYVANGPTFTKLLIFAKTKLDRSPRLGGVT